ncbi:uncharacterized protein Z518_05737 [Rhinocladiella mackenziei CBS 650.93]|uniref:Rhinocladiella mackenziei CBS 650.93 unplaced genomic scaffold supercont1.4, whole genome shotgun sequence n=1 Tax=Rhinocladiella mackenziei CBS 650.93 TaxID=1442369 RepID=A0A0D2INZ5_9EURO|nr:uncharacterized protein Z518_05737 [Rhinocladiella mackenziei CBS 650.93]KIX04866.1 hypothetical protein Z518_05737 [Rhinocladiella mackenziei CBS 650.93]
MEVGIEKTLKLLQSLSQIGEAVAFPSPKAVQWTTAKNQSALARRYFRLFKWIDCWTLAHNQYSTHLGVQPSLNEKKEITSPPKAAGDNIRAALTVTKWSLLGIYLFMEMFTITNAMFITSYWWGPTLQLESLKFWFYSIAVSILLSLYKIYLLGSSPSPTSSFSDAAVIQNANETPPKTRRQKKSQKTTREKQQEPSSHSHAHTSSLDVQAAERYALYKQLAIDSCDLVIPGSILGWTPLDPVVVGIAGSISAVLGASNVWARVDR